MKLKSGQSCSGTDFFFKFPVNLKMYLKTKEHLVAGDQIRKGTDRRSGNVLPKESEMSATLTFGQRQWDEFRKMSAFHNSL